MATNEHTVKIGVVPLVFSGLLWLMATALLMEDGWQHEFTVQHYLVPGIVAVTAAAAVYVHHARGLGLKLMFLLVAILGTALTVKGTVGRQVEGTEGKVAEARKKNEDYDRKKAELKRATEERDTECKRVGPQCEKKEARVTKALAEMKGLTVVALNPQVDKWVDAIHLVTSAEKNWLRQVINTFDPMLLGLFLDMGSIVFGVAAFPKNRQRLLDRCYNWFREEYMHYKQASTITPTSVSKCYTREEALQDLFKLRTAGSQKFLADRWQQSEPTVSKWIEAWELEDRVERNRVGKNKVIVALPSK